MKSRNLLLTILTAQVILFHAITSFANTASFSWLPSDSSEVKGYRIHYGTERGSYTKTHDIGSPKEINGRVYATVDQLASDTTYFFAATAYSSSSESGYSKEVSYTTPASSSGSTDQGDSSDSSGSGDSSGDTTDPTDNSDTTNPSDGTTDTPTTLPSIELGTLQVNSNWQSVSFQEPFSDPAVVAKAATINGAQPGDIRIRNITPTGFEIRFQEWDYLDGKHTTESVNFIAMDKGVHQIDSQTEAVAGCFQLSGLEVFSKVNYTKTLTRQPVVLASVTSDNEEDAVTLRMQGITTSSFKVALQEQEDNDNHHASESGCFIAWEQSSGIVDGLMFEAALTGNTLTDKKHIVGFQQQHQRAPLTFADMQTFNGVNTAVLRQTANGDTGINLYIKEEQSDDQEVAHGNETGGILALSPYQGSLTVESGEVEINHRAVRINFENQFSQPVVIARMASKNDDAPAVLRIYNVDQQGFTIRIQEYEYLDGVHGKETVNYIVMEQGIHTLDNGTTIEAGTFDSDATQEAELQKLQGSFATIPVILTSITSKNGAQAVTGRIQKISPTGFQYLLQEQEANTDGHTTETVSFLAWEPGTGMIDNIRFLVGKSANSINHRPGTINYDRAFSDTPIALADMQTCNGSDTATLAVNSVLSSGLEVYIEEEASKDSETNHTTEVGGYIALAQE